MEEKIQNVCLTYYNLLIEQDLWQAHYKILSIIFLRKSIELNVIKNDIKKCETSRIKHKYYNCFLDYINFKDDLVEYKCLCCNKNYQHKFDKKLKEQPFNTSKFLKAAIISENVFTPMNI